MAVSPASLSGLRLRWHDHGSGLLELTRGLLGRGELTDVTLTCADGVNFKAHRLVLAGSSVYFRNLFTDLDTAGRHPVIFLKDVKAIHMDYFLRFIYFGEVSVPEADLQQLVTVAKELKIKGLDGLSGDGDEEKNEDSTSVHEDWEAVQTRERPVRHKRVESPRAREKRKRVKEHDPGQECSKKVRVKEEQESIVEDEEDSVEQTFEYIDQDDTCDFDTPLEGDGFESDEDAIEGDEEDEEDETFNKDDPNFKIDDMMLKKMLRRKKPKPKPPKVKEEGEQLPGGNYDLIDGKRQNRLYLFDNYIYSPNKTNGYYQYLQCHVSKAKGCHGRAKLDLTTNRMTQTKEHNHPEETEEVERRQVKAKIMREAIKLVDLSLRDAFINVVKGLTGQEAFAASKISFESIERTMARRRKEFEQEAFPL